MNIVNLSHETLEMNESERFQIFFEDREVLDSEILHKFSNLEYWKNPNHRFLK